MFVTDTYTCRTHLGQRDEAAALAWAHQQELARVRRIDEQLDGVVLDVAIWGSNSQCE